MAKIKITEQQLQVLKGVFNDPDTNAEITCSEEAFEYLQGENSAIENKSTVGNAFKVVGKEAFKALYPDEAKKHAERNAKHPADEDEGVSHEATNRPGPTAVPAVGAGGNKPLQPPPHRPK